MLGNCIQADNSAQMTKDSNLLLSLLSSNLTDILMNNYKLFGGLDDSYSDFVNKLMTQSVCEGVLAVRYKKDYLFESCGFALLFVTHIYVWYIFLLFQLSSSDSCYKLQNSLLTKSYQNFYIYSENLFRTGFSHVMNAY